MLLLPQRGTDCAVKYYTKRKKLFQLAEAALRKVNFAKWQPM